MKMLIVNNHQAQGALKPFASRMGPTVYLVETAMENTLHLFLIKCGSLDLSSGVLVVERDCFA